MGLLIGGIFLLFGWILLWTIKAMVIIVAATFYVMIILPIRIIAGILDRA